MANQIVIRKDIDQLTALRSLSKVYGEIASLKMKKTRSKVIDSRNFLAEVSEVFRAVVLSYRKEVERLYKTSDKNKITLLSHNGREVAVLLSTKTGLYGEVIQKTFNLFANKIADKDVEITIMGNTGKRYFESHFPNRPYTYFDVEETFEGEAQTSKIVQHIVQYKKINIYYGLFRNVVSQEPAIFNLSADSFIPGLNDKLEEKELYIFEPDLKTILQFFETEIFASLFDQTMREHDLAKNGSRILAMNNAQTNIDKAIISQSSKMLKAKHNQSNKKQLDKFAGSILW